MRWSRAGLAMVAVLAAAVALRTSHGGWPQTAATPFIPRYTQDGKLMFPEGYREWTFVSSGLGMNYGPAGDGSPAFTNVFVTPGAYRQFLTSGQWPNETMFVLEVYSAASHGSILRHGSYQDGLLGVEAEVKDTSRFTEQWAYFGFGVDGKTGAKFPQEACWSCHHQNAAVENSFVQFYPTLLSVAYEKGTIKPSIHLTPGTARVQQLLLEQGWAKTEPLLDQIRATDPEATVLKESSLNAMGYRLFNAGKTADAVAVFERAVRDYPASPNAYDSLADAYLVAGKKSEALECSEKALQLLPETPTLTDSQRARIENAARERIQKLNGKN